MKNLKKIPHFKSEDAEREFWASHDAADYVNFETSEKVSFAELRPTTRSISIRLPVPLMDRLRALANKRDVPYQSLIKLFLAERVETETKRSSSREHPRSGTRKNFA
ncbi:MAG: BrnA antitoxin family protein [Leptospirales bacterium]|nr:BrnA antitoxin family protein [Leptospirales bacterium]